MHLCVFLLVTECIETAIEVFASVSLVSVHCHVYTDAHSHIL